MFDLIGVNKYVSMGNMQLLIRQHSITKSFIFESKSSYILGSKILNHLILYDQQY